MSNVTQIYVLELSSKGAKEKGGGEIDHFPPHSYRSLPAYMYIHNLSSVKYHMVLAICQVRQGEFMFINSYLPHHIDS